jgi:hypothetical protein
MRPLFRSTLLALAASLAAAAPALAGHTFGLFTCHRCCCKSCMFCVRPYNAFSPVACGSLALSGCMPFGQPGCGPCGGYPGMIPFGGMPCGPYGDCCGAMCSADGAFLPDEGDSGAADAQASAKQSSQASQANQANQAARTTAAQPASQAVPTLEAATYYLPYGYNPMMMPAVPGWTVPAYYPAAYPAR